MIRYLRKSLRAKMSVSGMRVSKFKSDRPAHGRDDSVTLCS